MEATKWVIRLDRETEPPVNRKHRIFVIADDGTEIEIRGMKGMSLGNGLPEYATTILEFSSKNFTVE